MTKNTCELRVGRLLEIRVAKGYESVTDVDQMLGLVSHALQGLPPEVKHITVADWRSCKLMSESASERATQMFMSMNPRTERSALLCSDSSPTAHWQFLRLIGSADNEKRRLFTNPVELLTWLEPVLLPVERERVKAFLATPGLPAP